MVEILQRTKLDKQQREYLEIIQSSSQTLMAILNDILDYSKIEAGKIDLEKTPVELDSLIRSVLDLFRPRARSKEIHLRYKIEEEVPTFIEGDEVRIRQVLLNLVYNAIKFTESGSIEVRVYLEAASENLEETSACMLHFEVEDTGIGIEENRLPLLFEPFNQADMSTTRKFGGTGLGLTICRNLVELMGGRIQVQSSPGTGSTFSFTLKTRALKEMKNQESQPSEKLDSGEHSTESDLAELRVLLAEDNEVNRKVALLYLKRMNVEADWVENGKMALERVAESHYDIVLMDMQMSVMDGVEATREIRKLTNSSDDPWIVALTAGALQENREQAFNAGFNDFITKPIHFALLQEKLVARLQEVRSLPKTNFD